MREVPSTQHNHIRRKPNANPYALNLRRLLPRTGRFDGERCDTYSPAMMHANLQEMSS